MDENKLKHILENIETPKADENARKEALNLAMAAYKEEQKNKSEKTSQGFPLLSRLMGNTNSNERNNPMEQKKKRYHFYGGAVAALALIIAAGISLDTYNMGRFASDMAAMEENQVELQRNTGPTANLNALSFGQGNIAPPSRARTAPATQQKQMMAERAAPTIQNRAANGMPSPSAEFSPQADMMMIAPAPISPQPDHFLKEGENRDKFAAFDPNPIKRVAEEPVSTFSVDVDTASYSFVRRQINQGVLPNPDAVRVEELINYFDYNYPLPETREQPFKPTVTIIDSPWAQGKKLMHIGIKGFDIPEDAPKPKTNLVFLLDVSGSMSAPDKLPLVKNSMKMLLDSLNPDDTVAIAVYAGAAGTVLEPTPASERSKIYAALDNLQAGGSTAGGAGINLAYNLAQQNFDPEAVNRVILATDGDFNVGVSNHEELKDIIAKKRDSGIFLSVLGFGQGNVNDQLMQTLAQNGNGIAAYIDSLNEARKVLMEEANSTLFPIAKDVKIQVEFNPDQVAEYRLIGYETRALNREDFNNDKIDAGDIGAGHTVTAIYELTPVGSEAVSVDPLRYGKSDTQKVEETNTKAEVSDEYAFLKIRYKLPNEETSKLISEPVTAKNMPQDPCLMPPQCPEGAFCEGCAVQTPADVAFATAVAGFGQLLKGNQNISFTYSDVIEMAENAKGEDKFGYRAEFINLVRQAEALDKIQRP